MTTDVAALFAIVLIAACTRADLLASSSPAVVAGAPPDVRRDCDLASYRCSQCHSLDRILDLEPSGADDWRSTVRRMRRMPGSMIAAGEVTPILTCLIYRSFGLTAARGEQP